MNDYRLVAPTVLVGICLLSQGCTGADVKSDTVAEGSRNEVVSAALSQIGTRYKYGAQSPGKALDCSALTQHAYSAAGIPIPRVSTAQRQDAQPVNPASARPGDLVFFRIRPGLNHVGLMIGDKRFVHASSSKKQVRISNIESDYWQSRLVGAGTYLN